MKNQEDGETNLPQPTASLSGEVDEKKRKTVAQDKDTLFIQEKKTLCIS